MLHATLLIGLLLQDTRASDLGGNMEGSYIALLIGIDHYREFKNLKTPVNDIEALGGILQTRYGFKVLYLRNKDATEEGIDQALQKLSPQKNDSLLIYFAGHGEEGSTTSGYWIPQDAQKGKTSTYYPNSKILDFAEHSLAKHVLIISDSCFAGSFFKSSRPSNKNVNILNAFSRPSRWVMASGNLTTVDDSRRGNSKHSPFAYHLLRVLQQSQKPYLTPRGITLDLMQAVNQESKSQQLPRAAALLDAGHEEGGSFIFWNQRLLDKEGNPYPPPWRTRLEDTIGMELLALRGRRITVENGGDESMCQLLESLGMDVTCDIERRRRSSRNISSYCSEITVASVKALRDYLKLANYKLKTHEDILENAYDEDCGEPYEIVIQNK